MTEKELQEYKSRHLETSKKIVEFIKNEQNKIPPVPNSNTIPHRSPVHSTNP